MGTVWASCEFSLLVSQQIHSDLSLEALDDALKQLYQNQGDFREKKMSKSAKSNVDHELTMGSHQLCEGNMQTIRAAMKALV